MSISDRKVDIHSPASNAKARRSWNELGRNGDWDPPWLGRGGFPHHTLMLKAEAIQSMSPLLVIQDTNTFHNVISSSFFLNLQGPMPMLDEAPPDAQP